MLRRLLGVLAEHGARDLEDVAQPLGGDAHVVQGDDLLGVGGPGHEGAQLVQAHEHDPPGVVGERPVGVEPLDLRAFTGGSSALAPSPRVRGAGGRAAVRAASGRAVLGAAHERRLRRLDRHARLLVADALGGVAQASRRPCRSRSRTRSSSAREDLVAARLARAEVLGERAMPGRVAAAALGEGVHARRCARRGRGARRARRRAA